MMIQSPRRRRNVAVLVSMWTMALGAALWPAAGASAQVCDPVLPKLTASDGAAGDEFGIAVSVSGDTAIVGAYMDDATGSAYIFARSGPLGSEVWTQQQKLTASDGEAFDNFGVSVSLSGDTAIVGAYADNAPAGFSGSAYVFVRSGPPGHQVWTQQQKLTASDGAAGDEFGRSVCISGDTAIMGAWQDNSASGSAYVFVRSGTVWTQQQKLTASDGAAIDYFGYSVSTSGDTAIVGAYLDDDLGSASGSCYVFVRSGTVWTQQQKLTASDGAAGDQFGVSVSISGDTAITGAWQDNSASGSAYVFVRSGTVWTQQQKLTASDGAADDLFGFSVSISGDTAIIGAYADDAPSTDSGSAYVFARSAAVWTQQQKLTASDGTADDNFGISASISGDTAIVGAHFDDAPSSDSGSAHVFECPSGPACAADVSGGDGVININDLFAVIAAWGRCPMPCPPYCQADIDDDCDVDIDDLFTVIAAWGPCT